MGISAALPHGLVILGLAVTATAGFFAATMHGVHGGPGAAFGFIFGNAPFLVALFYVLGLPLLLVGVFRFVSARHLLLLIGDQNRMVQMVYRRCQIGPPGWHLPRRRCIICA